MGNPGRSARVKVDPARLVGDLDRSECDMLHSSRMEVEVPRIPSSKLRYGLANSKRVNCMGCVVLKHNGKEMPTIEQQKSKQNQTSLDPVESNVREP